MVSEEEAAQTLRDRELRLRVSRLGPPGAGSVPVDAGTVERFRGRLPDSLLDIWVEDGFGLYGGGGLKFVNPDDYRDHLAWWLGGTGVSGLDTFHVIARGPFGNFLVWGERSTQRFKVGVPDGLFGANLKKLAKPEPQGLEKIVGFGSTLSSCGPLQTQFLSRLDMEAPDGSSLFAQCVERFGPLTDPTKVFGFAPYLFLGGRQTVDSVAIVDEFVQLDLIREFLDKPLFKDLATFPG